MEQPDALLGQGASSESIPTSSESGNNNTNMETLLDQEGMSLDFPQPGEIRTGVVASISTTQILVSVGAKSEGVITGRELEAIPPEERSALQVGQEILVFVLSAEDSSGNVVLSYTRAQEQKGWVQVEKLLEEGGIFEGKVDGFNKGGIIVPVNGLRGFVPASQLGISRRMAVTGDTPEARYASMIGEPITVRVMEVDRKRRRLILSERAASSETRQSIKEKVIESLKEGEILTGKVTSLADFGAFVNVNGADGLVHLSEISWEHIQHPSEVLEVGQEVQVKIINIDREKKRIGLSIRAMQNDPWQSKMDKFKVGQLVEGVITRLTKFGAFARLEGDLEGLIHISEISENRIEHPKEAGLHDGSVVTLRIIRIDPDQRRIGLSLRKVDSGAYKDLDLKQIDLEGVHLHLVDDTPAPAEETPAPVEESPAPAEETPTSMEEAPAPAEETPAPVEGSPAPAEEAPAPAEEIPAPVEESPAPAEEIPAPMEESPTPQEELPAPPAEEIPAPMEESPTPQEELPAPPTEQPAPAEEPATPPAEEPPAESGEPAKE
jgi:small subunit ribosomal protein S1